MTEFHVCPTCQSPLAVVARITKQDTRLTWRGVRQRSIPAGFHCVCYPNSHAYWLDERGVVRTIGPPPKPQRVMAAEDEPARPVPRPDADMLWERPSERITE